MTSPSGASTWENGTTQHVTWTLDEPVSGGEFGVWVITSSGSWREARSVVPVDGQLSYSLAITPKYAPGSDFKAAVCWRPTVGSGPWQLTSKSPTVTVTPDMTYAITSPTATTSWQFGTSQEIALRRLPAGGN